MPNLHSEKPFGLDRKSTILVVLFLSLAGVLGRMVPHAPNATPTVALGLIAGAALGRRMALFLPIAVLASTDLFLGTYAPLVMLSVYACLLLPVMLGSTLLGHRRRPVTIGVCALSSSLVFFVVTNLAVWASGEWYQNSLAGLMKCYVAALPFARNMIVSDLAWSAVLFTGLTVLERYRFTEANQPSLIVSAD